MTKKRTLDEILERISDATLWNSVNVNYIIIHPDKERSIFVNDEVPKSADLSEHLGVKVIISKEVNENEIVIGI